MDSMEKYQLSIEDINKNYFVEGLDNTTLDVRKACQVKLMNVVE